MIILVLKKFLELLEFATPVNTHQRDVVPVVGNGCAAALVADVPHEKWRL